MHLLIISFFAGILTAAAPCILPVLPLIIGGSAVGGHKRQWWRPLVITLSLAVSVIVFTLLLKATTSLLGVPTIVWRGISGGIIITLGVSLVFPSLWERISLKTGLYGRSNSLIQQAGSGHKGLTRDILTGAALGPVFSSCSPTYAFIVAVVLPQSFAQGFGALIAYALGLASILLVIAIAGQSLVTKLGWLSNPSGWFRRTIGILFMIVGVMVLTGLDHQLQTYILDQGWYDPIMHLEQQLSR